MADYSGTPGNDTYVGTTGNDTIVGNGGNDTLYGRNSQDLIDGGEGDDRLYGEDGGDVLVGGAGNDTLDGGAGLDRLYGGDGDDFLSMVAPGGLIDGGSGFDELDGVYLGGTSDAIINMRAAATSSGTMIGNAIVRNVENSHFFSTDSGNDTLILDAVAGRYNWYTGTGNDTLVISFATATTSVRTTFDELNTGDYDLRTDGGDISFKMFSYRSRSGDRVDITGGLSDDVLIGMERDDVLRGGQGRDNLAGQDGNDWIDGGSGIDTMTGGKGNDTFYVDNAYDEVGELLNQGGDTVYATFSYTLTTNVDRLYLVGDGDINGTGNGLSNSINGYGGNNVLDGGAGVDTLVGRGGNDTYYVDNGVDRVLESAAGGMDTVFASASYDIGNAYIETLILTGSAHINATGNSLGNGLIGNSGNNNIYGGLGADTMAGGNGNDTYSVENAGDVVNEWAGEGSDTVVTTLSYSLGAAVENLTLGGTDLINGTGNALDNIIRGNSGRNVLDGGSAGFDVLIGGAGDDTYIFSDYGGVAVERAGEGIDTVYALGHYRMGDNIENLYVEFGGGVGNALDNVIVGGGGDNHLDGRSGNDTLTGGTGYDIFVFGLNGAGDVITDFDTDQDRIYVPAYGGVVSITQSGTDSLIDLGGGNVITVLNTIATDVSGRIIW